MDPEEVFFVGEHRKIHFGEHHHREALSRYICARAHKACKPGKCECMFPPLIQLMLDRRREGGWYTLSLFFYVDGFDPVFIPETRLQIQSNVLLGQFVLHGVNL